VEFASLRNRGIGSQLMILLNMLRRCFAPTAQPHPSLACKSHACDMRSSCENDLNFCSIIFISGYGSATEDRDRYNLYEKSS
jgi:hypothetical protein